MRENGGAKPFFSREGRRKKNFLISENGFFDKSKFLCHNYFVSSRYGHTAHRSAFVLSI